MSELKKNGSRDADLHLSVLTAITGALREEKVPAYVRVGKVLACSVLLTALLATVFVKLFDSQMNRTWQITGIAWFVYFVAGFALLFKPQARMILSNVWSPFVIARLFLVSTLATILQIILCPSFVFLDSPLDWNPLLPLTHLLMRTGGMGLCMGFCGLLFTTIAGGLGLFSIREAAKTSGLRNFGMLNLILMISQLPVLYLQVSSPELKLFTVHWISGVILGFLFIFLTHALLKKLMKQSGSVMNVL